MNWIVGPTNPGSDDSVPLDCVLIFAIGAGIGGCIAGGVLCKYLCIMHVQDYDC